MFIQKNLKLSWEYFVIKKVSLRVRETVWFYF